MISARPNFKKVVCFGLLVIIIFLLQFWWRRGAVYPLQSFIEREGDVADLFNNVRFQDINAVVPYEVFTLEKRFTVDQRPESSVAINLLELEQENVRALIKEALSEGQGVTGGALSERHFQYGLSRHLAGLGEEYTLVFRAAEDVFTARVYRPLKEPVVSMERRERLRDQPVHIVMPLMGRLQRLQEFLRSLAAIIDQGDNVYLTVVAFADGGNGSSSSTASQLAAVARDWRHASRLQLVHEQGDFSRGRALLRGADAVSQLPPSPSDDPLLFLCDVDMEFSALELERCRVHAERGRAVYYPIVFSQFNPRLRQALWQSGRWPPEPAVSAETGHWRHYGFGMSCQYRSDFLGAAGRFLDVSGWGGEDVELYRRQLQRLRVVRAFDEDLVHGYHGKQCSERLSAAQYRSCVRSKITNEGNQVQLGLLALSAVGDLGPRAYRAFHLPWFMRPGGWATLAMAVLLGVSVLLNVWQWRRTVRPRPGVTVTTLPQPVYS